MCRAVVDPNRSASDERAGAAWWQSNPALERWVRDLIHAEMVTLRPATWRWPQRPAGQDVHLLDDAGVDSLDLLSLQGAVAEALDLRSHEELMVLHEQPSLKGWTQAARLRLQREDSTVAFASSGTTGKPQRHAHRLSALEQEMDAMADVLEAHPSGTAFAQGGRILSAVRSQHIYGFLFTVLLPHRLSHRLSHRPGHRLSHQPDHPAGHPTPEVIDLVGQPAAVAAALARPGDLVVGFPSWWQQALRPAGLWPPDVIGVTSTAPCPPETSALAAERGLARWLEIYGSTETAGVAWREEAQGPFRLHPFWRRAQGASACACTGEDPSADELERCSPEGVWGPARPAPDHLQWTDATRFRPAGRRDGVVQVGGVNVDPKAVQTHIAAHPAVAEVAVRPCSQGGDLRLKAFVVPRSAIDLIPILHEWCRAHLPPAARPVDIRLGATLPRNEMGKLRDWDVSGPFAAAPEFD